MKKWKIIKNITIVLLIIFLIIVILDLIQCISLEYPQPMLGIDARNWMDLFRVDLLFMLIYWAIPLIISIVLLIISILKIKKYESSKNDKQA